MENIKDEILRLENELSILKKNHQSVSARLETLKEELNHAIPALTRLSQTLTEEEDELVDRLNQFQAEINLLKENNHLAEDAPLSETPIHEEEFNSDSQTDTEPVSVLEEDMINLWEEEEVEPAASESEEESKTDTEPVEQVVFRHRKSYSGDIFSTFDLEKFVGENIISKLGILILLIGVAIGGKYAIDHEMLSPAVRIIIGTTIGLVLQGVAMKLKKEYKKFSAILSSGSSAILYFMTFFAYGLYDLIPKPLAFILMVLITTFSIFTAWWYDMEIVAIIGQVGAYVIPVLLSDGTGSTLLLWTYIALIDTGILIISVRKYWQKLFAVAFVSTWLIVVVSYRVRTWDALTDCYGVLALFFAFFAIFYFYTLFYKVRRDFDFVRFDILSLLSNSFLFFALGYHLIHNHGEMVLSLPVFAIINALIHCCVCYLLYKKQLVDKALQRLVLALGVIFITVAVALGLSGHWITIFWMMEALALFWVGRTKRKPFYENMAYPVLLVGLVSLTADWGNPQGADFEPLVWLATMFAKWRTAWDPHFSAEQGAVLPWVTTAISLLALLAFLWIDNRYPAAKNDKTAEWKSKVFQSVFLSVLTISVFVHFSQPVMGLLLSLECAVAFLFSRKKENRFFERITYGLIVLTALCVVSYLAMVINDYNGKSELYSYMRNVLISSLSFVLSLAAIVFTDRFNPCKEVGKSTQFNVSLRILWIYFTAFVCFAISYPYLQIPANILIYLWTILTVLFFFIGRCFSCPVYEKHIIPILSILFLTWILGLSTEVNLPSFLASVFFIASFFVALWINRKYEVSYSQKLAGKIRCLISVLILILAKSFISDFSYWFSAVYFIDFAMGFLALTAFFASKNNLKMLARFALILLMFVVPIFMLYGLSELSEVREHCLHRDISIHIGYYLFVRYLSLVVAAVAIAVFVYYRNSPYCTFGMKSNVKKVFYDTFLVFAGLAVGTSELLNIFDLMQYSDSYKLALSIFWGCCSMFLIYFGLFRQMKHLRVYGFILFAVILIKLFFFDLKHLDTLAKTIVFVSLGILLLVSSFFYQRIASEQQKKTKEEESED